MQPKLSILIPTTPDRCKFIIQLKAQFNHQLTFVKDEMHFLDVNIHYHYYTFGDHGVEIIYYEDNKVYSIGYKRNMLLNISHGEYTAFIDSDDRISENYFDLIFEGIEKGVDCCSLKGIITENGNNPLVFEHSIKYKEYLTNSQGHEVRYERYPNHLNCIKASIAKRFKFPEVNHGEDTDWATQIFKSGLIKTEHYIPEIIYYYDWMTK